MSAIAGWQSCMRARARPDWVQRQPNLANAIAKGLESECVRREILEAEKRLGQLTRWMKGSFGWCRGTELNRRRQPFQGWKCPSVSY